MKKTMNTEWSSTQYLQFKAQRNQPAIDLIKRISELCSPDTIADLGCGPGNSTELLKDEFPQAKIIGIDLSGQYDLLFSNACLQWIPEHQALIPELLRHLNPGGILAVQIPMNNTEPLYQIIKAVTEENKWNFSNVNKFEKP